MTLARRMIVIAAIMLWQGGFTFYGAVVVPTGTRIIGSDVEQGFITREVTNWLNLIGVGTLMLWAVELRAERLNRWAWLLWAVMAIILVVLIVLHPKMEDMMDPETHKLADRRAFKRLHKWYLNLSTVQWASSLGLLALTLRAWGRSPSPA